MNEKHQSILRVLADGHPHLDSEIGEKTVIGNPGRSLMLSELKAVGYVREVHRFEDQMGAFSTYEITELGRANLG